MIGGVITSTILSLVVIPTVYEILDDWRAAMTSRFRKWLIQPERAHGPEAAPPLQPQVRPSSRA